MINDIHYLLELEDNNKLSAEALWFNDASKISDIIDYFRQHLGDQYTFEETQTTLSIQSLTQSEDLQTLALDDEAVSVNTLLAFIVQSIHEQVDLWLIKSSLNQEKQGLILSNAMLHETLTIQYSAWMDDYFEAFLPDFAPNESSKNEQELMAEEQEALNKDLEDLHGQLQESLYQNPEVQRALAKMRQQHAQENPGNLNNYGKFFIIATALLFLALIFLSG